jgi:hypothetical protein
MLSAAKHLTQRTPRCFAALSMTWPMLLVKVHHRVLVAARDKDQDAMMNFHEQDRSGCHAERSEASDSHYSCTFNLNKSL